MDYSGTLVLDPLTYYEVSFGKGAVREYPGPGISLELSQTKCFVNGSISWEYQEAYSGLEYVHGLVNPETSVLHLYKFAGVGDVDGDIEIVPRNDGGNESTATVMDIYFVGSPNTEVSCTELFMMVF